MFIGAGIWDSGYTPAEETLLFYHGYGHTEINQVAVAYYRCERVIQDIAAYCDYLFLSDEGGEDRLRSLNALKSSFLPNGACERALEIGERLYLK